jgi:hypothetical protein
MLKKLFVTAAAAAAVSVPLAGVAWADPPPDRNNPPGQGGVPAEAGAAVAGTGLPTDPNPLIPGKFPPSDKGFPRLSPGSAFSVGAKTPCAGGVKCNAPEGYAVALNNSFAIAPNPPEGDVTHFVRVIPGSATRLFTPGCGRGNGPVPTSGGDPQGCF